MFFLNFSLYFFASQNFDIKVLAQSNFTEQFTQKIGQHFEMLGIEESQEIKISKLGIHVLNKEELSDVKKLFSDSDKWHYMTVILTLDDLKKPQEWQTFFEEAKNNKIIPIVRLATRYNPQKDAWEKPTKKDVVDQINFLSTLDWYTDNRYLIIYNETNHAKEWGGVVNPEEYAETLAFATAWAKTEPVEYQVLPAAMDLAAPNGNKTMEAFTYLKRMQASDPEVFAQIDVWNSHSYPNPDFTGRPQDVAKNSIRGFEHELAFIKTTTGRELTVMITETGWRETAYTRPRLNAYYTYAMNNVWSDTRVLAVTPFILNGAPGPFSEFSFLDQEKKPTKQYEAMQTIVKKEDENSHLISSK